MSVRKREWGEREDRALIGERYMYTIIFYDYLILIFFYIKRILAVSKRTLNCANRDIEFHSNRRT
jgi:hypothetical protein